MSRLRVLLNGSAMQYETGCRRPQIPRAGLAAVALVMPLRGNQPFAQLHHRRSGGGCKCYCFGRKKTITPAANIPITITPQHSACDNNNPQKVLAITITRTSKNSAPTTTWNYKPITVVLLARVRADGARCDSAFCGSYSCNCLLLLRGGKAQLSTTCMGGPTLEL